MTTTGSIQEAWRTANQVMPHTCPEFLRLLECAGGGEGHPADRCPGEVTLEEVVALSFGPALAA